jgi:hypothetical protein
VVAGSPGLDRLASAGRGQAWGGTEMAGPDYAGRESRAGHCSLLTAVTRDRMSCGDIVIGTGRFLRRPEAGSGPGRHWSRRQCDARHGAGSDIVKDVVELLQLSYDYCCLRRPLFECFAQAVWSRREKRRHSGHPCLDLED